MTFNDMCSSLPAAVVLCDAEGIITYMNSAAVKLLSAHGGRALLGSNLFDCHPPAAQEKIRSLMRERKSNVYTTEKRGVKRLVYQAPWIASGELAGLVEISFEVPSVIPNFKRD